LTGESTSEKHVLRIRKIRQWSHWTRRVVMI